jgi:hypothetical protein
MKTIADIIIIIGHPRCTPPIMWHIEVLSRYFFESSRISKMMS